jgi:hypothetical protein
MQGVSYLIQTQFTSIGAMLCCRIIQGFFNNVNSLGKAFVFEFSDVDYIGYAFSSKGFLSIVLANFFPRIGTYIFKEVFDSNYVKSCWFWFGVNAVIAGLFFLGFFVWKYSENTQEAVSRRNKLLKESEMNTKDAVKEIKPVADKKEVKEVHYSLPRVMKHILSDRNTILMLIIYVVSKAINKSISTYRTVIFLKDKNLGGLEFTSEELGNWNIVCIFPSFIILFV